MLNENMYAVAVELGEVIVKNFPIEYQIYVFDEKLTLHDIIGQILVECCKYAYDNTAEKHSLNYHMKSTDLLLDKDSERMILQRTMSYIQERRMIQHDMLLNRGISVEGLIAPDMENIKDRLAGYQLNDFQYWEINNVHNMRLVKAIVERRLPKKNFNTDLFKEYAEEYDCVFQQYAEDWKNGDNVIFDFLALFTLEWKYSFDFYYELATEMLKSNVSEIPDMKRRLVAFSGTPSIYSLLLQFEPRFIEGTLYTDSRMLVSRRKYIHEIVTLSADAFEEELTRFNESIVLVSAMLLHMTYKKIPIRDWFIKNSSPEDWLSVFRNYDVFQTFNSEKDWSNKKKIRYVKEIYNAMSYDYKNPEYRS